MKPATTRPALFLASGLFFCCLDQGLKFWARTHQTFSWYLWRPWLGWEYFANPGIAFGIPLPNSLIVIITPLILLYLAHLLLAKKICSPYAVLGIILIMFGAISNWLDRVVFGITIDYVRVATSVLNIADLMIGLGALLIVFATRVRAISADTNVLR